MGQVSFYIESARMFFVFCGMRSTPICRNLHQATISEVRLQDGARVSSFLDCEIHITETEKTKTIKKKSHKGEKQIFELQSNRQTFLLSPRYLTRKLECGDRGDSV